MADHDMHFLSPCRYLSRNGQADVAGIFHLTAAIGRHADNRKALRTGFFNGFEDVAAVAGRRNADQDISFFTKGMDLTPEYRIKAVVISDGRQDRRVDGQGDSREGRPFFLKTTDDFSSQVLRVGGAAAIAAKEDFVA